MRTTFWIVPLLCAALFVASCSKPASPAVSRAGAGPGAVGGPGGGRIVPVAVATARRRDVPIFLDGLGSVTAIKTVAVRAQVDGRLDQVFFQEGKPVRRGEVLAQIDPRPFLTQLHQAQGALARDEAQLAANRRNLERYEDLARRKLIAQQQADDQRALVGQGEGALRVDRAAVEAAQLNLDYARIVSPIDGVAGIRSVDPGNLVHASDPTGIVVLTQLDPIAVLFTLPQDVLPQVAQHQDEGPLEVQILSRDGASELGRGKLEVIDNVINATTATLRFKAVLPNPKRALWPNQFVKARLMLTVQKDALVVPAPALQRGPEGTFVYVVGADQTAQARLVTVGLLQGDDALIAKGLEAGDRVVTEGQSQLRPGSKVAPRSAGPPGREGARPEPDGARPGAEAPMPRGEARTTAAETAPPQGGGEHR